MSVLNIVTKSVINVLLVCDLGLGYPAVYCGGRGLLTRHRQGADRTGQVRFHLRRSQKCYRDPSHSTKNRARSGKQRVWANY